MIVVKYPFISILNIECIANACNDHCKATTPIVTKSKTFCLLIEANELNISQKCLPTSKETLKYMESFIDRSS
jgi:hypothetical protein